MFIIYTFILECTKLILILQYVIVHVVFSKGYFLSEHESSKQVHKLYRLLHIFVILMVQYSSISHDIRDDTTSAF